MEERHAHEVMEMMIASGKPRSRADLVEAIEAQFGKGTTFYTCSSSGLSAEALVQFLEMKGKFIVTEEAVAFNPERMCQGH